MTNDVCTRNDTATSYAKAKKWKQPKRPVGETVKISYGHLFYGIAFLQLEAAVFALIWNILCVVGRMK